MKRTIMKVQLPLAMSPGTEPFALVYDEDRTVYTTLPVTDELRRKVGDRPRSYWYGRIEKGDVRLEDEAPAQGW